MSETATKLIAECIDAMDQTGDFPGNWGAELRQAFRDELSRLTAPAPSPSAGAAVREDTDWLTDRRDHARTEHARWSRATEEVQGNPVEQMAYWRGYEAALGDVMLRQKREHALLAAPPVVEAQAGEPSEELVARLLREAVDANPHDPMDGIAHGIRAGFRAASRSLVTCVECGFRYGAEHRVEATGDYECPVCELATSRAAPSGGEVTEEMVKAGADQWDAINAEISDAVRDDELLSAMRPMRESLVRAILTAAAKERAK